MKLHIFGASGSGVTTLGMHLSKSLNLPYFDSDNYFWEKSNPPFTIRRDPDHRNSLIKAKLDQANSWIMGGSIINWGENVFSDFDLIVFLWIPVAIRISRLKNRELERYGEVILSDSKRKKSYDNFIKWAEDYDNATGIANRTLKAHEEWLSKRTCPVLEIREDLTIEERLKLVLDKLNDE